MKVKSIINTQIEFTEEMSEEDFSMFNTNSIKSKAKLKIAEMLKNQLQANNVLVKSYRFEKENIDED